MTTTGSRLAEPATHIAAGVVPERCYRDAPAGIAMLERAFGFMPALMVTDGDGSPVGLVVHAELWAGRGCVMAASLHDGSPWNFRSPREIGGANTSSAYLAVADIDAAYRRARDAGCTVVRELNATEYGSRDFSVTDGEGFLWHLGTYRPVEPAPGETPAVQLFAGTRYADGRSAIAWLVRAFGAVEHLVVPGDGDTVAHAQLTIGDGLFMLGTARDDEFGLRTPAQIGGAYTQSFNAYTADPDAHHARAVAAGATILAAPADTAYGARGYTVADCEGHVWNFSTYRPQPPG